MKAWEILGYTADADVWCEACAEKRYGPDRDDPANPRLDSEGNEVHPIFASEAECGEVCGECGTVVVEEPEEEEPEEE